MDVIDFVPKAPLEPAGYGPVLDTVEELILKNLYLAGEMNAAQLSQAMKVHVGVINKILQLLSEEQVVTIAGKGDTDIDLGSSFSYTLYKKGLEQARNILEKNPYIGPCPVTMKEYQDVTKDLFEKVHKTPEWRVTPEKVNAVFSKRIGYQEINDTIGQAAANKQSIFLYGGAGNGKTNLSSFICKLLPPMVMPYCIEINKQIVKCFDEAQHKPLKDNPVSKHILKDQRWVTTEAPFIMVGGEMNLPDLEVQFDEKAKAYLLPPQVQANGGVFLIDDLGRQLCSASDIFNRLIVPLENHVDFMNLGGIRMEVMTDEVMIFSSNLDPMKIMDPAFLRRIPYKIEMRDPYEDEFVAIWELMLGLLDLKDSPESRAYLLKRYKDDERPYKASQPRDILRLVRNKYYYFDTMDKVIDTADIDEAYDTYFPKGIVY